MLEEQGQPLGMFEASRFGLIFEILEALGHAVKAKAVQEIEGGMSEHWKCPSMEVAGAAQVWVLDDGVFGGARPAIELVGDDGGDALVSERTDGEGAGCDELGPLGFDILEEAQHAETGAEALLGMWPVGEYGEHEPLGVGAD